MFRIDTTTAAGSLPTPAAPGQAGYFTNGNPALGVPATVVDQDWFNRLQEEVMSVLAAASISPVKSNYSQLLRAIQACFVVNDVGAVNVLVANPTPAFTSLVLGAELTLIPLNTNTGTATLNVSSLGALAVLRPDGTVVQPGDLPAGRRIPIIYDGAAWRLLNWPVRVRLGTGLTLYCNPQTGNDSNNGLTPGTAFASLQGVYNWLYANVDVTGQVVTVQCSGSFTAGLNAQTVVVGATPSSIVFNFAAGATITVTNGTPFIAANPGVGYTITGPVVISCTGSSGLAGFGMVANYAAQIYFSGVNFGACAAAHITGQADGQIQATGSYTISGSSPQHILSQGGAFIYQPGVTVTLTGTPAFSAAFAVSAQSGGQIYTNNAVFSGSATGSRYAASMNGTIWTIGAGASYLPGNAAGTLATGGQYG